MFLKINSEYTKTHFNSEMQDANILIKSNCLCKKLYEDLMSWNYKKMKSRVLLMKHGVSLP